MSQASSTGAIGPHRERSCRRILVEGWSRRCPNLSVKRGTINLNTLAQLHFHSLHGEGLTELVPRHEGHLVLAIEISRHLQGVCPYGSVHEQADC
jgi:hypothetical protein